MIINSISNSTNVSCHGYLKDQRLVRHNLLKAKFRYNNLKTSNREQLYRQAQAELDQFILKNPFRAILFNIPRMLKRAFSLSSNQKDLISSTNLLTDKFNSLEFEYDGQKSSYIDFKKRIYDEKDFSKKEEMSLVLKKELNTLQEDMRCLIGKRNEFARTKGYDNYYQYQLEKKYGTTEAEIDSIIEKYYTENNVFELLRRREEIIAQNNNTTVDELSSSHIRTHLYTYSGINDYIKTPQQVIDLVKKSYISMGYDIEQLEKEDRLILDLEQDDKKISRIFCQNFLPGYSVGICASIYNDIECVEQLMHEMGHGMHFLNPFKYLPKSLMRHKTHISEAVALMFESLVYKESLLDKLAPESVVGEFKQYKSLDEAAFFAQTVICAQFEKELYKNPEQDFETLLSEIEKKYYGKSRGNPWLVPHFINSPGYMQNYIRATLLSEQIYNAARMKLGTELSSNPNTSDYLKKRVFGFGSLVNDKTLNLLLKL